MKPKLYYIFLLVGALFISSSFAHPIKLTSSLLEYNAEENKMVIQCRVFIDDFINTINKKDFNAVELSKEDITEVECYFWDTYRITLNDVQQPLNYYTSKAYLENNVLNVVFTIDDLMLNKGDKLLIKNALFFGKFGVLQSNKMIVRIPPFVSEDRFETTMSRYLVYYEF